MPPSLRYILGYFARCTIRSVGFFRQQVKHSLQRDVIYRYVVHETGTCVFKKQFCMRTVRVLGLACKTNVRLIETRFRVDLRYSRIKLISTFLFASYKQTGYRVRTYQETSSEKLTRNSSENIQQQSSQLVEPPWTYPGL